MLPLKTTAAVNDNIDAYGDNATKVVDDIVKVIDVAARPPTEAFVPPFIIVVPTFVTISQGFDFPPISTEVRPFAEKKELSLNKEQNIFYFP